MIDFRKIMHFIDIAIVLIAIFAFVKYVEILHKKNIDLEMTIIVDETKLLNNVRIYEYTKSQIALDLLECRGENKQELDSIRIRLDSVNLLILKRDSTYIGERILKLKNDVGL